MNVRAVVQPRNVRIAAENSTCARVRNCFFARARAETAFFQRFSHDPRVGGSDFGGELRGRRGRASYQNVLVTVFCAADQRNVRFRHAKCMRQEVYEPFVRSALDGRRRDPHEESSVAYAVNTLSR